MALRVRYGRPLSLVKVVTTVGHGGVGDPGRLRSFLEASFEREGTRRG